MNILKFIDSFTDEDIMNAQSSRRDSLLQFGEIGKKIALTALPFGLLSAPNKLMAEDIKPTPATPVGALQFALILEYLEDEFYAMALDSGVIPASENNGRDLKVFEKIAAHEKAHVDFLIAGLGGTMSDNFVEKPTFDFTVGGAFDPFNDYPTFLALAQAFEDTGVRAYKGQAGNLIGSPDLLTAALQIHSVEARHASEVRRIRGLKGWITDSERGAGMPEATQAVYAGEDLTVQAGFDTSSKFGKEAGTEAYDEPLTTEQVVDIANIFIV